MAKAAHRHADLVSAAIGGHDKPPADAIVFKSWLRSAKAYKVDPGSNRSTQILTEAELRRRQEAAARLVGIAQHELDHLYNSLRTAGYVVLLCDPNGTVIDCRGDAAEAAQYKYWGVWMGGVWSEESEGTNGIGTCAIEQLPVTVHRSQHFRARHITLSCSGAPIFDGDNAFVGILDVSSIDPQLSEHAHALSGPLTIAAARAIEERIFRCQFRREWIIAVRLPNEIGSTMLLSVNRDECIIGSDRIGRDVLAQRGHPSGQRLPLWTLFERNNGVLPHKNKGDLWATLRPAGTAESCLAIVTPPEEARVRWMEPAGEDLRFRPRLDALITGHDPPPANARGGLSPAALRRVREYVDAHLEQNIGIEALAASAGLSPFHFARTFKQSEGMTPHSFVLQRRIAKARELLPDTDLSLSAIALMVGFADQSHFTRRFHEVVGVSPGQFRKHQA